MPKQQKRWMSSPSKPQKPKVPDHVKQAVKTQADELIESVLKPTHLKEPPENQDLNYLIDIFSKWYRNYFYFCATYRSPGSRAISPSFETKFARMEYCSNGRYILSYFRYTDQWWELYSDLTAEEAFQHIREEPSFLP